MYRFGRQFDYQKALQQALSQMNQGGMIFPGFQNMYPTTGPMTQMPIHPNPSPTMPQDPTGAQNGINISPPPIPSTAINQYQYFLNNPIAIQEHIKKSQGMFYFAVCDNRWAIVFTESPTGAKNVALMYIVGSNQFTGRTMALIPDNITSPTKFIKANFPSGQIADTICF
ncbi:hypothetical protein [Halobacillus yeomjeoni]|uniref:Uncharacterized protein n=1 Tax=Halobacillus yeomjeoni TaxID=311194 RepID=A0A931HXA6_9BACI|nr:hypothetical protein [Halobacillus yeomjeoni]MBH0231365.1 hypothetical protein [Halobacillus yeomjeoni]